MRGGSEAGGKLLGLLSRHQGNQKDIKFCKLLMIKCDIGDMRRPLSKPRNIHRDWVHVKAIEAYLASHCSQFCLDLNFFWHWNCEMALFHTWVGLVYAGYLANLPKFETFSSFSPNYQWPSTTHTSPWHPRALPIKASEGPQDLKVLVGWFPWKLTWIDYLTNLYYHGSWATFDVCLTTQHGKKKKTSHWGSLKLPANSFIRLAHVPARPPPPTLFSFKWWSLVEVHDRIGWTRSSPVVSCLLHRYLQLLNCSASDSSQLFPAIPTSEALLWSPSSPTFSGDDWKSMVNHSYINH